MLRYRFPSCRSIRILMIRMSGPDPWMLLRGLLPQEADRRCDFVGVDGVKAAGVESLVGGDVSTSRQDTDGDFICCDWNETMALMIIKDVVVFLISGESLLRAASDINTNIKLPLWVLTADYWRGRGSRRGCRCRQPGWSGRYSGCQHMKMNNDVQIKAHTNDDDNVFGIDWWSWNQQNVRELWKMPIELPRSRGDAFKVFILWDQQSRIGK